MRKINLNDKLSQIHDHWHPRIVAELNDSYVKLVKIEGEFVWHHHETEDELFLVLSGELTIQFRDRDVVLHEGEIIVVPHGVEHCPLARGEVSMLLLEPKSTLNTGTERNERTAEAEWI
ncbi:MAG TPA: cupin domain-containing protein [Anaerolineaceae bacterium]|nr:cupin domain-containing protein [Anaerolineaceae bacterium]